MCDARMYIVKSHFCFRWIPHAATDPLTSSAGVWLVHKAHILFILSDSINKCIIEPPHYHWNQNKFIQKTYTDAVSNRCNRQISLQLSHIYLWLYLLVRWHQQIKPQLKYLPALQCTRHKRRLYAHFQFVHMGLSWKLVTRSNPYVYIQFSALWWQSEARAYLLWVCACDASDRLECWKNPPRGHPFSVFVTASVIYTLECKLSLGRNSTLHARWWCKIEKQKHTRRGAMLHKQINLYFKQQSQKVK
jgi:hypothetical protein